MVRRPKVCFGKQCTYARYFLDPRNSSRKIELGNCMTPSTLYLNENYFLLTLRTVIEYFIVD